MSEILYHYTSTAGFYNIVMSKSIHCGHTAWMNDKFENKWLHKMFDKAKQRRDFELTPEWQQQIERILRANTDYIQNQPFLFCLSKDEDLLSQWRAYGDDGKGVAIGFDKGILEKLIKEKRYIELKKVDYLNPEKETARIIEIVEHQSERISSIKHPAFLEEGEWRIIVRHKSFDPAGEPGNIKSDVDYKVNSGGELVPYYNLSFEDYPKLIKEIIVGPKHPRDFKQTEFAFRKFLIQHYRCDEMLTYPKVIQSKVPYQ